MQVYYVPNAAIGTFSLDPDESRHCIKVLRKKNGDNIQVCDGKGFIFESRIIQDNFKNCQIEIHSAGEKSADKAFQVHLYVAPTKSSDRMEWMVEKATELMVDSITFFVGENSERGSVKLDRMEKKAISAMKQAEHGYLPQIRGPVSFADFIEDSSLEGYKYIAYAEERKGLHFFSMLKEGAPIHICIGPEGDFSKAELLMAENAGFHKVSLGNSRFRTETAAILACHMANTKHLF